MPEREDRSRKEEWEELVREAEELERRVSDPRSRAMLQQVKSNLQEALIVPVSCRECTHLWEIDVEQLAKEKCPQCDGPIDLDGVIVRTGVWQYRLFLVLFCGASGFGLLYLEARFPYLWVTVPVVLVLTFLVLFALRPIRDVFCAGLWYLRNRSRL